LLPIGPRTDPVLPGGYVAMTAGNPASGNPAAVEFVYRIGSATDVGREAPSDPEAARQRLDDGNAAFAKLLDQISDHSTERLTVNVSPYDVGLATTPGSAPRQLPFAAVVGCADARVPIELIFTEGPNDLFVIRVAGNGLGSDVLGSLNYAVEHLGDSLKAIVILGHSNCGALSAAVDVFLQPARYLAVMSQDNLRPILDRTLVVIQVSADTLMRVHGNDITARPGYRAALIETAVVLNAALGAHAVQQNFVARSEGRIAAHYGVYLLEERRVWAPWPDEADWYRLAPAPHRAMDFRTIGDALVKSPRIVALLDAAG
jgi:carbonic anhydrase